MPTISVQLDDQNFQLVKRYAAADQLDVSAFLKQTALNYIQDQLDIDVYESALHEYHEHPALAKTEAVADQLAKKHSEA